MLMQAKCQNCNGFSPVDQKSKFCRYCGTAFAMDVAFHAQQTNEAVAYRQKMGFRVISFVFGPVLLALLLTAVYVLTHKMTLAENRQFAETLTVNVVLGAMVAIAAMVTSVIWLERRLRAKYPYVFKNDKWRLVFTS